MVPPVRPTKVDVGLLYQDYEPFSYGKLVQDLQLIAGDNYEVGLGHHHDELFGVVIINGVVLKISQNSSPLALEGLQACFSLLSHK